MPRWVRAAAIPLLVAVVGSAVAEEPGRAPAVETTLYHPDRDHLWNRLYAAFFLRVGPDGVVYGGDRLEPLLWEDSEHLVRGEQADLAAVLDEFLRTGGETRIDDPLKRAMLQRDLWLVAGWLAGRPEGERGPLFEPIVAAVRRLALTADEIARLPDTYAAAVASGTFAAAFDPDDPERAYLPPDLFDPAGPWVCVGRTDGPTAPSHLASDRGMMHNANAFTNSAFLTFLKLPAGRDAGLAFLNDLARRTRPMFLPGVIDEETGRTGGNRPNPDLPQLPRGTELALVRRALLIDATGRVVASPLTEMVQLRVFRSVPGGVPDPDDLTPGFSGRVPEHTAPFEYRLRRADLFAGRAGGLRDVSDGPASAPASTRSCRSRSIAAAGAGRSRSPSGSGRSPTASRARAATARRRSTGR